jgi:hypothetical protein
MTWHEIAIGYRTRGHHPSCGDVVLNPAVMTLNSIVENGRSLADKEENPAAAGKRVLIVSEMELYPGPGGRLSV